MSFTVGPKGENLLAIWEIEPGRDSGTLVGSDIHSFIHLFIHLYVDEKIITKNLVGFYY